VSATDRASQIASFTSVFCSLIDANSAYRASSRRSFSAFPGG